MQSFTFAEFVSLAAAKVWAGKADFPNTAALWAWYDQAVVDRLGYGRWFQFYGAERTQGSYYYTHVKTSFRQLTPTFWVAALRFFVGWLNEAATKYGGRQIDNLPAEYVFKFPVTR